MKKVLLILIIALLASAPIHAKDVDISNNQTMQALYDNFLPGFFEGVKSSLKEKRFPSQKINAYMKALKKRIKKQDLINETYPCLSKVPVAKLETDGVNCFVPWVQKTQKQNADLLNILK